MLSHLTGSVQHRARDQLPPSCRYALAPGGATLTYHDSPLGAMSVQVGCMTLPIRTSADEHAQTSESPNMATATPLPRGPRRRRSSTPVARCGRAAIRRQNPSSRGRGTEGLCLGAGSLHSGHLRGIGPEPGTWTLIPGGAAGDQGLRIGLAARQWRLRDSCGLSCLNDFLALRSQAHLPSCNGQVTSISIHMARPGPASAPRGHAPL